MADDRRIITGTHIVAKEGNLLEDGLEVNRKWKMDDAVGKTLGGKSIITDVNATQNFAGGNAWYQGDNKSSALSVLGVTKPTGVTTNTDNVQFLYVKNLDATNDVHVSLTTDSAWDSTGEGDHGWAVGTNWETDSGIAKVPSYDQRWDEGMYIIVPPGGSVQLRGDSTGGDSTGSLDMEHVRFRSSSNSAAVNIEYVLAE